MRIDFARVKRVILAFSVVAPVLAGCGDEPQGDASSGGEPLTGPLYAYQTIEYSSDLTSRNGYLKFASSLDASGKTDESRTIELTAVSSLIFASTEPGEFYLAEASAGQIIRYALGSTGRVEEGAKISFAAYGVGELESPLFGIASRTKAYLLDNKTLQSFVWDPSTMTIQKNGDLSGSFKNADGAKKYSIFFERSMLQVGKKLVGAYNYYDPTTLEMPARSGLVIIDTETDKLTVVEHPTCAGLGNSVIGPDGYVYVGSMNSAAAIHYAGKGPPTCIVRLDPEKGAFDETFNVDLSKLVGTASGGLAEQKGSGVYVWGVNEKMLPPNVPKDSAVGVISSKAWETYRIDDVTNPTTATLVDTPPLSFVVTVMRIDGAAHFPNADLGKNETTLMNASTDPPTPALLAKGWIQYALRVQ
jgi:hypothetical protein